ncbi:hypothetical protein H4R33_000183 [Dimargaris cristalligena]|nr:hypothetical protein H4R33_000183 [Dimargaris cristalligena]
MSSIIRNTNTKLFTLLARFAYPILTTELASYGYSEVGQPLSPSFTDDPNGAVEADPDIEDLLESEPFYRAQLHQLAQTMQPTPWATLTPLQRLQAFPILTLIDLHPPSLPPPTSPSSAALSPSVPSLRPLTQLLDLLTLDNNRFASTFTDALTQQYIPRHIPPLLQALEQDFGLTYPLGRYIHQEITRFLIRATIALLVDRALTAQLVDLLVHLQLPQFQSFQAAAHVYAFVLLTETQWGNTPDWLSDEEEAAMTMMMVVVDRPPRAAHRRTLAPEQPSATTTATATATTTTTQPSNPEVQLKVILRAAVDQFPIQQRSDFMACTEQYGYGAATCALEQRWPRVKIEGRTEVSRPICDLMLHNPQLMQWSPAKGLVLLTDLSLASVPNSV